MYMHRLAKTEHIKSTRDPIDSHTPVPPNPSNTIQSIQSSFYHDRFPNTAIGGKTNKYGTLIQMLKTGGWNVYPLVIVTVGLQGVVHKQSLEALKILKILPCEVKKRTCETRTSNNHKISRILCPKEKNA